MTDPRNELKSALNTMIITECDKADDYTTADIPDELPLIGSDSPLGLDSLDALQISLAVKKRYGVRIEGAVDGRKALASIDALADYILTAGAAC